MPSAVVSVLSGVAFVIASMAGIIASANTASAAPVTTHTVDSEKIVGHQPTKTRVSVGGDRSEHPLHRAAPWTPLAVTVDEPVLDLPSDALVVAQPVVAPWHSYDLTTPQGRAPPR